MNWLLNGEDLCGLKHIKAFYINPDLTKDNTYHSLIIYDVGMLYEPDVTFTTQGSLSNFDTALKQNQGVLQSYTENKDLQLYADQDAMSIEPIYINNEEVDGEVYLNINYPFVSIKNNVMKGYLT